MSLPDPTVASVYAALDRAYGDETWHWSPNYVQGPMDVIAGAVLVQHTTWTNADRALEALRSAGELDPKRLIAIDESELQSLVRVSGTPSVKARRLRALAQTIVDAGGLEAFLSLDGGTMRDLLLATHGVGRETADAILLFAAGRRAFVIDAYTRRLFGRIGLTPGGDSYESWQRFFEAELPEAGPTLFQRYHAWIVLHSKAVCRAAPLCAVCPIAACCATGRAAMSIPG